MIVPCCIRNNRSNADTGLVTIALGATVAVSNAANTNTVTTGSDPSWYLVITVRLLPMQRRNRVSVTQRMARVFNVQKLATWADQNITLRVKGAGINNYLLISTDPAIRNRSAQELQLDASGSGNTSTHRC